MKKIFAILLTIIFASSAQAADNYEFDANHVNIIWFANHFGFSNPSGKFTDVSGKVVLDEKNPQNSSLDVTIKINSLSTGLPKFDNHLKSADFLNADKYPTAKFVSTSVKLTGKNKAKVSGDFTLLGVTKPLTLDVTLNKLGLNQFTQKKSAGFSAKASFKRSDFGIDYGIPGVSDEVRLLIEAELNISAQQEITISKEISKQAAPVAKAEVKPTKITTESKTNSVAEWKIISEKSKLEFKATQDKSPFSGSFKKFGGKINFDPAQLKNSQVAIEVDTSSVEISLGSDATQTVKASNWLSTKAFPKATFNAENFSTSDNKKFQAKGNLTIKNKTIPATLDFVLEEYSNSTARAVGSISIKRSQFEIGDKDPSKANGVQEDVVVNFVINAKR
jgi:polyisoprenoid-binding protein YceI